MVPPDQALELADLAGPQRDGRLVVDDRLVPLDRPWSSRSMLPRSTARSTSAPMKTCACERPSSLAWYMAASASSCDQHPPPSGEGRRPAGRGRCRCWQSHSAASGRSRSARRVTRAPGRRSHVPWPRRRLRSGRCRTRRRRTGIRCRAASPPPRAVERPPATVRHRHGGRCRR